MLERNFLNGVIKIRIWLNYQYEKNQQKKILNRFKKKLKVFKKIPNNFSYNSRDNDQFLSINELKKMIAHVGNFKKSDVG